MKKSSSPVLIKKMRNAYWYNIVYVKTIIIVLVTLRILPQHKKLLLSTCNIKKLKVQRLFQHK